MEINKQKDYRVVFDWNMYTDGDYSLRHFQNYGCKCYNDDETYSGILTFDGKLSEIRREAANKLKEMLCDIHVGSTHYYLLQDFVEIFNDLIDWTYNAEVNTCKEAELSGNYDGTEFNIYVIDPEELSREQEEFKEKQKYFPYINVEMLLAGILGIEKIKIKHDEFEKEIDINDLTENDKEMKFIHFEVKDKTVIFYI